jgi:hypothetical protein
VDALLVPFSIMWCGFAVFWEISVLTQFRTADEGPPIFFALWGVPFVLVGLYLVFGRLIVRAVASRRTQYVITDRRVLVIGGLSGRRTTSVYLTSLPPPVIAEGPDGAGSLAFGAFPGVRDIFDGTSGWRPWSSGETDTPVLWDIYDVRRVRDLIVNAQSDQSPPSEA